MDYEIKILPRGQQEIYDAYNWYRSKQEILGDRFLDDLEKNIEKIKPDHLIFPISHKNSREILLDTFPYILIYTVNNREIII